MGLCDKEKIEQEQNMGLPVGLEEKKSEEGGGEQSREKERGETTLTPTSDTWLFLTRLVKPG